MISILCALVLVISLFLVRQFHEPWYRSQLTTVASHTQKNIENNISMVHGSVASFAQRPDLWSWLEAVVNPPVLAEIIEAEEEKTSPLPIPQSRTSFQKQLDIYVNSQRGIKSAYLLDTSGKVLLSTDDGLGSNGATEKEMMSHNLWLKTLGTEIAETQENTPVSRLLTTDTGLKFVTTQRILNQDSKWLGSLVIELEPELLSPGISDIYRVEIITPELTLLVGADGNIQAQPVGAARTSCVNPVELPRWYPAYRPNGVLESMQPVSVMPWCVSVSVEQKTINQVFYNVALVLAPVLLIALMLVWSWLRWGVSHLLQPLRAILKAIQPIIEEFFEGGMEDLRAGRLRGLETATAEMITYYRSVQKQADRDREQAEEMSLELMTFKQTVDNASDSITILYPDLRIAYINRAMEENSGYKLTEVAGRRSFNLWRRIEDHDEITAMWAKLQQLKQAHSTRIMMLTKDKKLFLSEVRITPILNEKGEVSFFLIIEHRVPDAKMLEFVKDDFISIASHELRTPLTVIREYLALVADGEVGELNQSQKDLIEKAREISKGMAVLVDNMLDLSQLNYNNMTVNLKVLDLESITKDIVREFAPSFARKKIQLSYQSEIPGQEFLCKSDRQKLVRIFNNLISNAHKFTPEGGQVVISIGKFQSFQSGTDYWRVSIRDNGEGIPQEVQKNLFKRFFQVDNVLSRRAEGTGLGLSISKGLIEKLGGEIWVESQEGKGSVFSFTVLKPDVEN